MLFFPAKSKCNTVLQWYSDYRDKLCKRCWSKKWETVSSSLLCPKGGARAPSWNTTGVAASLVFTIEHYSEKCPQHTLCAASLGNPAKIPFCQLPQTKHVILPSFFCSNRKGTRNWYCLKGDSRWKHYGDCVVHDTLSEQQCIEITISMELIKDRKHCD